MTSWRRVFIGQLNEGDGKGGIRTTETITEDAVKLPDLLIHGGADKARVVIRCGFREDGEWGEIPILEIPISVKECPECGGDGEVYWTDTEDAHGCGGDERLCAEICPVPVGVQAHAPCPNNCINGWVPKEDGDG